MLERKNSFDDVTAPDLLRECGRRLTNHDLWELFQARFQRLIFMYVLRALRLHQGQPSTPDVIVDLAQEVYVRLVQNDGRVLRNFRGTTEFSARAFLGRIAMTVVADHCRREGAGKRRAEVIPIDHAVNAPPMPRATAEFDVKTLLSWIDIERFMEKEGSNRKNAARNTLIFQLRYIEGLTAAEIAAFPGFRLSESGVEVVLQRLLTRLRRRIDR